MKNIADVTSSFRKYLETQKSYLDYLRNRPRFFLSTHYVDKRLVIVKTSKAEAKKEEEDGSRRRRRKPKQPTKVPVKKPVREVEQPEVIKEPVSTPIKVPPIIKPPVLSLPGRQPAETPAAVPLEPKVTPLETPETVPEPKPVVPAAPPKVPAPTEVPVPAKPAPAEPITLDLDETATPMSPVVKPPMPMFDSQGRRLNEKTGQYTEPVEQGMRGTDPIGDLITLAAAAAIVFGLPALLGGGAVTGTGAATTGGVTATSKIVGTGGALTRAAPAANKIVPLVRQAAPVAFSYGGRANAATFSLAGERTTEAAVPLSKLGEFFKAIFKEAGSIATGLASSVIKKIPAGSAITSQVSKLASIFGTSKGFTPDISVPSQIPSFDVSDSKTDSGVGGVLNQAIKFGKGVASTVLSAALMAGPAAARPTAQSQQPAQPQDPVIIPETDPSVAGMSIIPAGKTDSDNVSGFPITSHMGMRTDPIDGGQKMHGGYDISAPSGKAVGINKPGEIVFAGVHPGYGNMIDAWVPSLNLQFRLAHLSVITKPSGQFKAGQILGRIGSTGRSTGPHLHFETHSVKGGSAYGGDMNREQTGKATVHLLIGESTEASQTAQGTGEDDFIGPVIPGAEGGPKQLFYDASQKTSQTDIVRQQTTRKLEISRVNSIVEIPIQGPPSYTPQLQTIMREKSSKRPYMISPFSKGVEQ